MIDRKFQGITHNQNNKFQNDKFQQILGGNRVLNSTRMNHFGISQKQSTQPLPNFMEKLTLFLNQDRRNLAVVSQNQPGLEFQGQMSQIKKESDSFYVLSGQNHLESQNIKDDYIENQLGGNSFKNSATRLQSRRSMLLKSLANVFIAYGGWSQGLFGSVKPAFASSNIVKVVENLEKKHHHMSDASDDTSNTVVYQYDIKAASKKQQTGPIFADASMIVKNRKSGTCPSGAKVTNLRFGTKKEIAKLGSCFSSAVEKSGYAFRPESTWISETNGACNYYFDSIMGRQVFIAPVSRNSEEFIAESKNYGWPSFRDDEINWDVVRVITETKELVTIDGIHLGKMKADAKGNRYCVNLTSISGESKVVKM